MFWDDEANCILDYSLMMMYDDDDNDADDDNWRMDPTIIMVEKGREILEKKKKKKKNVKGRYENGEWRMEHGKWEMGKMGVYFPYSRFFWGGFFLGVGGGGAVGLILKRKWSAHKWKERRDKWGEIQFQFEMVTDLHP